MMRRPVQLGFAGVSAIIRDWLKVPAADPMRAKCGGALRPKSVKA
jgi:hypothetical protein